MGRGVAGVNVVRVFVGTSCFNFLLDFFVLSVVVTLQFPFSIRSFSSCVVPMPVAIQAHFSVREPLCLAGEEGKLVEEEGGVSGAFVVGRRYVVVLIVVGLFTTLVVHLNYLVAPIVFGGAVPVLGGA
jgi:hypothetical protein